MSDTVDQVLDSVTAAETSEVVVEEAPEEVVEVSEAEEALSELGTVDLYISDIEMVEIEKQTSDQERDRY